MVAALSPLPGRDLADIRDRAQLVATRQDQVYRLLRREFGDAPDRLTHMPFGHASVSFAASVGGRDVIARTNADLTAYDSTLGNLEVLRAFRIPVPEVIGSGTVTNEERPFAWMLTRPFRGRDLLYGLAGMNKSQVDRLAAQIADFQFRSAAIPRASKYGFAAIGADPPHDRWIDVTIADSLGRFEQARGVQRLKTRVERLERAFEDRATEFDSIEPTCFLDDLTTKNVIVHEGELSGVVDFDCVCFGDRRYQVGLTQTGVVADVGPQHLGYIDRLSHHLGLGAADGPIISLYSAWFGVEFLRYAPLNTAWAQRLISFVDRWLTEADA